MTLHETEVIANIQTAHLQGVAETANDVMEYALAGGIGLLVVCGIYSAMESHRSKNHVIGSNDNQTNSIVE